MLQRLGDNAWFESSDIGGNIRQFRHRFQPERINVAQFMILLLRIMKSLRKELWFEIPSRRGFVNITAQVAACLRESGVKEGLVLVNAMHITASVFINDDESGLHKDYTAWLEKSRPTSRSSSIATTIPAKTTLTRTSSGR